MGRRPPNGVARVRAQTHDTQIGGYSRSRPAAGPCGHTAQVVRISSYAHDGTDRDIRTEGPLGHIGFGQNDRARFTEFPNLESVIRRDGAFQRQRTARGL